MSLWTPLFHRFHRLSVAAFLLCALLLAGGCVPPMVVTAPAQASKARVEAIAVYPFEAMFTQDPTLAYERTVDLVQVALAPSRFQVYSYRDFQLFPTETVDIYQGRTLLNTLAEEGRRLKTLAILRGGARLRGAIPGAGVPMDLQPAHHSGGSIPLQLFVELYHFGEQRVIARGVLDLDLDTLRAGRYDPYPALTRHLKELGRAVMAEALRRLETPEPYPAPPVELWSAHRLLFQVASDDTPSLARRLQTKNALEQDTALLDAYRHFYPKISIGEAKRLNAAEGLLVRSVRGSWLQANGLQPGDIILAVDGHRVYAPHQLDRRLEQSHGKSAVLKVLREDNTVEVVAPTHGRG